MNQENDTSTKWEYHKTEFMKMNQTNLAQQVLKNIPVKRKSRRVQQQSEKTIGRKEYELEHKTIKIV